MSHRSASTSRRIAGTSGLALLLSMGLGGTAALAQPSDDGLDLSIEVTDRGPAAAGQVSTSVLDVGTLPDGTNVMYAPAAGEPSSLSVVNIDTGELIDTQLVPPKTLAGATYVFDDGSLMFNLRDGSGVNHYRWDAETHEIELAFENPAGERLVRSLEADEDGVLYGVTYPNAKLFSYDPETGDLRDYGSLATDDSYAEALAVHNGVAYVGTGMEAGHFVAVDLDSGEMTQIEVPAGYEHITRFYKSQLVGDLVATVFSPGISGGTNTLFWDTVEGDWVCDGAIPRTVSLNAPFSSPTEDGRMFYKAQGEIWAFDSNDCSVEATGWIDTGLEDTGQHRAIELHATGEGDDVQYRLVGLNRDGSFWTFNLDDQTHEFFEGTIPGTPLTAHSLHVAADERVYMGTYHGPGVLGRFDPSTGDTEQISGPSQADSWLTFQDQLLVGSYGNAIVHAGDPFAEWDWGTNPAQQFRLIDGQQQDRIVDQATDGDLAALATVSDYGVRGGALTLTDMADYRETFRDLVDYQSTAAVTFGDDGLIYAGTSIRGGLSSANSPEDAHLVVFDPEAGEVIEAVVPVEGNDVVAGLVTVGTSVWGVTNSAHLFEYDAEAGEILDVYDLGTSNSASPWGLASTVQAHPEDGLLYGISGNDVFAFDPVTKDVQILLDDSTYKRMDIADDGTIYVIDETNLFSITIQDDGAADPGAPVEQVRALQSDVADYIEAGDIAGPIAHQLTSALGQAEKHLDGERTTPAIRAIERAIRHLENPKRPDTLSEQAQTDLLTQAGAILNTLQ